MKKNETAVYVILGSKSDTEYAQAAMKVLESFGVSAKLWIASAHRSPQWLEKVLRQGEAADVSIYICAAGGAAHLPGVVAARVLKPVIGVGIPTKYLGGVDSLLSIVGMPSGVPVATMSLGETGMKNAAYFALEILALGDKNLLKRLHAFREQQALEVQNTNQ